MESLAIKYRPKTFDEVCGQNTVIKILKRQSETKELNNCYIFSGSSGTGKTTIARIFANEINDHIGTPIEIDAASNNGVDNVRDLIAEASQRTIDGSTYKVIILDECHMITTQGWNAFLKCLEEPPKYTIFIFCTTNLEKVPDTIKNRAMTLHLGRIDTNLIVERLTYVCEKEGFKNYKDSIDFIARISDGSLRTALSHLDKCAAYCDETKTLNLTDTYNVLDCFSYDNYFALTNAIIDKNVGQVMTLINKYYIDGCDWNTIIDNYLTFLLELTKYTIFKDMMCINIPACYKEEIDFTTGVQDGDYSKFFIEFTNKVLEIKSAIRYDTNAKGTILVMLMDLCK